MKRILIQSFAVLSAITLASRATATEAVYSYSGSGIIGYVLGGAGFAFSPQTDIFITSLGYNGGDLVNAPYQVSIWNSTGDQLVSALVTSGSPLLNQTRYQSIPALGLSQGSTYYLQAVSSATGFWAGDVVIKTGPDMNGTFLVSPDIIYLASARELNGAGDFPNIVQADPQAYFVGGNFQYAVPEPSVLGLMSLGAGLLVLVRRQKVSSNA